MTESNQQLPNNILLRNLILATLNNHDLKNIVWVEIVRSIVTLTDLDIYDGINGIAERCLDDNIPTDILNELLTIYATNELRIIPILFTHYNEYVGSLTVNSLSTYTNNLRFSIIERSKQQLIINDSCGSSFKTNLYSY